MFEDEWDVVPKLSTYQSNSRISLSFLDAHDGSPILTATVNLPEYPLPEGCAFIKSWSENEGVLDWLLANGMVSLIKGLRENIPTGRVNATMVVLNLEAIARFMA